LAEANQAYEDLRSEPKEKILEFAKNFGWKIATNTVLSTPYEFLVSFADYLRNTTHLREKEWKLVNRVLSNGNVYLRTDETARLLKEEVRKHIEKRLEVQELPKFPQKIIQTAEKIKKLSTEKIGKSEVEEFPKTIVQTAFPPCIRSLYESISTGRHLSHVGRFTLTSFLVSIGMSPENVIELFRSFSDFNERMTSYQVQHIAGDRGSRTRYIPPRCDTLQTHAVCVNPDDTCRTIRHPLGYYRRKIRKP
jgi:DNA primase large subunit